MSQAKVSSYYNTRKKRTDVKGVIVKAENSKAVTTFASFFEELQNEHVKTVSESTSSRVCEGIKPLETRKTAKALTKKANSKPKKKTTTKSKGDNAADQQRDIRSAFATKQKVPETSKVQDEHVLNVTFDVDTPINAEVPAGSRTPKRNSSDPNAEDSSSKKKKVQTTTGDHSKVRRKLVLSEKSTEEPQPKADLPVKSLSSYRVDELKDILKKQNASCSRLKDCQSNKFKITTLITKPDAKEPTESHEIETSGQEYLKLAALATAGPPSLILPKTFRLLNETFRCLDTVVSILYNRKEVCTFVKVKSGVQEMTKKAFSETQLAQVQTVFPEAYTIKAEKNTSSFMNRNPGAPPYVLVVNPNLKDYAPSTSPKKLASPSKVGSPSKAITEFMSPSNLVERRKRFSDLLLQIVQKHHQAFLHNLKPPIHLPVEKLTMWHQKFPLDSVPDIEPSILPDLPHIQKITSAQVVLNNIRGKHMTKTLHGEKVEKALQSIVDKSSPTTAPKPKDKGLVKTGSLKGVPIDLLERIRAREAANAIKDMTKTPEEKRRSAMLERIPELVRIIRTYFITERKAAVPLETAKKKICDSYHTTINEVDAQQHIQLIAEIFPKWLFFVPIPRKGVFVKIDKNMDINVLIQNMPKQ